MEGGAGDDGVWPCCADRQPGWPPLSDLPTCIREGAEEKGLDRECPCLLVVTYGQPSVTSQGDETEGHTLQDCRPPKGLQRFK